MDALPFCQAFLALKCWKPKETDIDPKTGGEHIKKRRLEPGLNLNEAGTPTRRHYSVEEHVKA
jgi:hypothetical protein